MRELHRLIRSLMVESDPERLKTLSTDAWGLRAADESTEERRDTGSSMGRRQMISIAEEHLLCRRYVERTLTMVVPSASQVLTSHTSESDDEPSLLPSSVRAAVDVVLLRSPSNVRAPPTPGPR